MTAQTGGRCPFFSRATNFDPLGAECQANPADVLRWSCADEPVFFSRPLGYWVVSRYDDIEVGFGVLVVTVTKTRADHCPVGMNLFVVQRTMQG